MNIATHIAEWVALGRGKMGNASFWLIWRNSANELQTFECGDDELIIGHSQDARLSFPSDAEKEVSIDRLGSDLVLGDTAQGVLLNGAVVTRRTLLEDGDTISLTNGVELRLFTDEAALDDYMTQQTTNAVSESPATESDPPLKTTPSADSTPTPIIIDATKINTEVCKYIKPTPTPIIVVPPIAQLLFSSFLFFVVFSMIFSFWFLF